MGMTKKILYIILIALIPYGVGAQGVALVLSGGGAKAFSHIGVLKALEENNIPIDYVVGSSMGALVGAMYASGYTPNQIEVILTSKRFLNFTKENNTREACFYQVDEPNASFTYFTFNVDKGFNIQIPFNVYDLKKIDYSIMEFFAKTSAVSGANFDSLMIPFRCVASDIDSSRLKVFDSGNLAKSVRASITFPFFIRPIKIDDVVYFDGGMYDNFPVDIAMQEFNPSFIIGSKGVNNFSSPNPDNAVSLMQSMLMTKADFVIDTSQGVLIESNTGQGTIFDFSRASMYIDSGYIAALDKVNLIKNKLDYSEVRENVESKRKRFNSRLPKAELNKINIKGLTDNQAIYFEKLIGDQSRFSDPEEFNAFYQCLVSNENIVSIYPEIEFDTAVTKFNLNLQIKQADRYNLGIGGYISSSGVNEGFIDMGFNSLGKSAKNINVGAYFGTFYNSFYTVGKIEFPNEIPVSLKAKILISRKNYFSNARYFTEDQFPVYIIADENYFDFSVGTPIAYSGILSAGMSNINANFQYYQNNYFSRSDTADVSNYFFLSPYIGLESNTLNRKEYATKGHHFLGIVNYYSGTEKYQEGSGNSKAKEDKYDVNYYSISIRLLQYFKISPQLSVGLNGQMGYSNKTLQSNYVSSLLMATPYEPIPVMRSLFLENYRSNIYGGIGGVIDYNFFKKFNFRVDGYYYVPYEKINKNLATNQAFLSEPLNYHYVVGSARIVYRPPIGVVSASVNYIEKPGNKIGFLINLGYLIFNKSQLNR